MKEIQDFKGLQALRLEGNTVGVEAAQAIAKALETKSEFRVCVFILDLFYHSYFESCNKVYHFSCNRVMSGIDTDTPEPEDIHFTITQDMRNNRY